MEKFYFAIDVGGTSIKGGIVDENNNILYKSSVPTVISDDENNFNGCILSLIKTLEQKSNLLINNSQGLGIGIPGEIDAKKELVCVSHNLKLKNYPIVKNLKKDINVPIKIINDANAAALAEFKLGSAKGLDTFVMLTLGTGIGGDFYVNGMPFSSFSPFSGEFGHIKISGGNHKKCACGEYDCYELYGSTKALVNQTRKAMLKNKNSKMWQTFDEKTVNGKTIFEYLNKDNTANEVFSRYIEYLGTGIVSISNLLMPKAFIIGGSISNQGKALTKPLEDFVNSHIYAKNLCHIDILPAKLGADAGILGAKLLFN